MNAIGDAAVETEHVRICFTCSRVAANKKRGKRRTNENVFFKRSGLFLHVLAFNAR